MNDLKDLIALYTEPAVAFSGPRVYSGAGFRILDAKEGARDIATEVAAYAAERPETRLDVWARRINNDRAFCPLIDCAMVRGTPPPFTPTGLVEAGAWVVYLWALAQRVEFKDYDRVEALRYRLSTMSIPRREVEEGFYVPGTAHALEMTTRTQRSQFYSYGPVDVPLTGNVERRAVLVHFDPMHRVRLEELEALAPQVNKPRTLTGAITR